MKNAPRKLELVSSLEETPQSNSPIIGDLVKRWHEAEKQLSKLLALEEEYFEEQGSAEVAQNSPDDLLAQLEIVSRIHRNLLTKLTIAQAENSADLISKLKIWQQIVLPDGGDMSAAQPIDLLVNSVLSDMLNGTLDGYSRAGETAKA